MIDQDTLVRLCAEIEQQVDAQAACIHTGSLQGVEEYGCSVNLLFMRVHEELAARGSTLDAVARELARAKLESASAKHAANLKALEQQFEMLRADLIRQFERGAQVVEYRRMQTGKRHQE